MKNKIKRNRSIEELVYCALFLAISAIFLTLANFFYFSFILIVLFIPFISCVLARKIRIISQLLYLVCLCIFAFVDPLDFLFYMIPNTIIGLVFGNLSKLGFDSIILYSTNVIIASFLNILAVYLLKLFFKVDTYNAIKTLLNIGDYVSVIVTNLMMILVSILSGLITYTIIQDNLIKYIKLEKAKTNNKISIIFNIVLGFLLYCFAFGFIKTNDYISTIFCALAFSHSCTLFTNMLQRKIDIVLCSVFAIACLLISCIVLIYFINYFYLLIPFTTFGVYFSYFITRIHYLFTYKRKDNINR